MKSILIIFMLLTYGFSVAQKGNTEDCNISIKTSPLNLVDPWNGTLTTLGAEFKLHNNFASYTQAGAYIPGFNLLGNLKNNKGYVIKEELKYYLNRKRQTVNDYVSVELSYSQQKYNRTDTIDFTSTNPGLIYAKYYAVSRNFTGIVFQYGTLLVKWEKLVLDIYGGIGVRFNNISCDLTDDEAEHRKLGDWDNPSKMIQRNGMNVIPRINLGIKIGYKLR